MDFITEIYNKIVKLIFDILTVLGVNTDYVPDEFKPVETPEA
jgi:hypothetical protein